MKAMKQNLTVLIAILFTVAIVQSCKDDDKSPNVYFKAKVSYNAGAIETYECDEYSFEARIDSMGSDTLVFEGERSSDGSYMYFNLITDDIYDFQAGDSISIPYDLTSGMTEVFASVLVTSLSNEIFQPYGGSSLNNGTVYIDELDIENKKIKGRFNGKFFSTVTDSLTVTDGEFLIDE